MNNQPGTDTLEIHATAVSYNDKAVIFIGEPGSGKSDMALRLLDRGGVLIGDDRVIFKYSGNEVCVFPHSEIAGKIEVRGVGICTVPFVQSIPVGIVVQLVSERPERNPEKKTYTMLDKSFPLLDLYPFEPAAVIKLCLVMEQL